MRAFLPLLPLSLLVCDVVSPEVLDLVLGPDDAEVHVGAGAHVVEDAGSDGVANELLGAVDL